MRGEKQKKQRSLSSVNSIFFQKKIQRGRKKKETSQEGGVVKLKAFIHNLLRENSFRKINSLLVHGQFVYVIETILTMKSEFLLFRINILKRKVFRKKFDIVQSLDFNPFFFFWNMKFHPCLFTFFCELRIRKAVTVNLICSETSCDFVQYVRNFCIFCSRDTKTLLKKGTYITIEVPQTS